MVVGSSAVIMSTELLCVPECSAFHYPLGLGMFLCAFRFRLFWYPNNNYTGYDFRLKVKH